MPDWNAENNVAPWEANCVQMAVKAEQEVTNAWGLGQ